MPKSNPGKVELLEKVASLANEAVSVRGAFRECVKVLGEALDWDQIHTYLPQVGNANRFNHTGISWHKRDDQRTVEDSPLHKSLFVAEGSFSGIVDQREYVWLESGIEGDSMAGLDWAQDSDLGGTAVFPIVVGKRVVGILEFNASRPFPKDDELVEMLSTVAVHLGHVYERKEWEAQLSEAVWAGQRRAGQAIHDGLGQQLTAMGLLASRLAKDLERREDPASQLARDLLEATQEAKRDARALMRGLMPVEVGPGGLRAALEELAHSAQRSSGVNCSLEMLPGVSIQDTFTATHLFRIAQEAINNALKHSQATEIQIQLVEHIPGKAHLTIRDNGIGFDPTLLSSIEEGLGMRILRRRADLINASLSVHSSPGGGTSVECNMRGGQDAGPLTIPPLSAD